MILNKIPTSIVNLIFQIQNLLKNNKIIKLKDFVGQKRAELLFQVVLVIAAVCSLFFFY